MAQHRCISLSTKLIPFQLGKGEKKEKLICMKLKQSFSGFNNNIEKKMKDVADF